MERESAKRESGSRGTWTFLTNHAHVLICIAQNPSSRIRDLAASVGITERAVQRIITELKDAGYLTYDREGRRNRYRVHGDLPMRHPVEGHCLVSELLATVLQPGTRSS
jgi:DNA-binding transcriptional ArsR family regulator